MVNLATLSTSIPYQEISRIALPIMVSSIAIHFIGFVDTIFLAQISEVAIGASGNAILFYYMIISSLSGLAIASQIIIGRRNGEGNFDRIGSIFKHSILFTMLWSTVAWILLNLFSASAIELIYASEAVAETTTTYLDMRSFGIWPALINFCFTAFFVGTTNTRPIAIAAILLASVNIIFDYFLIFGIGVFPEMGVKGAALASVIAETVAALFLIGYTLKYVDLKKYGLHLSFQFERELLTRIWVIGRPLMLQYLIAMAGWSVFFSIIEHLGERPLAVSHIIRAIYLVIGIPLTAWADASNTLVSNLIGQNKQEKILPTIWKIMWLLLAVNVTYILLLNLFPIEIISLFTSDETLIADTIPTLRVISFSTTFFAIGMLFFRSLAGAGMTALCMRIEFFAIFCYLVLSFSLVEWFDASTALVWCTEFLYFSLLGVFSFFFLRKGVYNKSDF